LLLVGYGTDEETGIEYWLLKNDFGTDWGEDGFARIERGGGQAGGMCGILLEASYPLV